MTGMRFQTVTIFLAAVGLITTRSGQSPRTGALILVVSIGLWLLDLRNRDVLRRLGNRGKRIESEYWLYAAQHCDAGRRGFFLDGEVPAEVEFLLWRGWTPPGLLNRVIAHAFAIDIVFLGIAGMRFRFSFSPPRPLGVARLDPGLERWVTDPRPDATLDSQSRLRPLCVQP
jgi:hypothetical protein